MVLEIEINKTSEKKYFFKERILFNKSETLNSLFIDVAVIYMSVGVHLSFASLNGDLAL